MEQTITSNEIGVLPGYTRYIIYGDGNVLDTLKHRLNPINTIWNGHTVTTLVHDDRNLNDHVQRKTFTVATLVMKLHGSPQPTSKHRILHIDGDLTNNDIDNLRWAHYREISINMHIKQKHNYKMVAIVKIEGIAPVTVHNYGPNTVRDLLAANGLQNNHPYEITFYDDLFKAAKSQAAPEEPKAPKNPKKEKEKGTDNA